MIRSRGGARRWAWLLLLGSLALWLSPIPLSVLAEPQTSSKLKPLSASEAGRSIFNGKGVCYYCHGLDGYLDKMPRLAGDTALLIARLNPPPPDLRNPKSLRLTSDAERVKAIREGHPGTGMFPDTTMTEQELADTLAYLTALRKEGHTRQP